MSRDFGIQFRMVGRSPKMLILLFLFWLDNKMNGYSTVAFFITLSSNQDIFLCKDKKVWNPDMLEVNDYQMLYDVLEHETMHGVFADLLTKEEKKFVIQRGFDWNFNTDSRMIVPKDVFESVGFNTPSLPDSTVEC